MSGENMKFMKNILITVLISFLLYSCSQVSTDKELQKKAQQLAHKFIMIDTHIDVPYRLKAKWEDVSKLTTDGNFDYPRAIKGGLDVPFMSIYVPATAEEKGTAKAVADTLLDIVESLAIDHPDKFSLVSSVNDINRLSGQGKVLLAMGMENGAPIEGDLKNLAYFHNRGIRYITLTHSKSNHICDSSYDTNRHWKGLSPFGREVVKEMNRLGIMIDISHVTDSTFYQVIKITKAPVIASHSSCRHFTPGWERNVSDDIIKAIAKNHGVVQINFGSSFVNDAYRRNADPMWKIMEDTSKSITERRQLAKKYQDEHPMDYADIKDVATHIDHVVILTGIDHVGIGSDFDGLGDSLPNGLKDVSEYPNLIFELLKMGYSDEDIEKICGGNLLRVWAEVERISQELSSGS
jgi:membrane dipeptidase